MKKLFIFFALCFAAGSLYAQNLTFHDYVAATIQGDTISMSQYFGKKIMVVNTASQCGFTPQYTELQDLYDQYKQYNFEILGFPCNDFNHQEPGSDSAIDQFCTNTYNITFRMMSKIFIVTGDTAPVYKWLQRADLNGVQNVSVSWNFNKFLIDEAGQWVKHYNSPVSPLDTAITNWIISPSVIPAGISDPADETIITGSFNPATSSINLMLKTSVPQYFNIDLYSAEGRWIGACHKGTISHSEDIHYPAASLPGGIYFIRINGSRVQKTIRCAIVH